MADISKIQVGGTTYNIKDVTARAQAKELTFTLTTAGWTGSAAPYTQTVSVSGLAAASKGVVGLTTTATDAQYEAAAAAELAPSAVEANKITIKARGTKPTINLPCVILIVG